MADRKHIYIKNELKNNVLFLDDTDLWGIGCALQHAIQDGHANENLDWHKTMVEAIDRMRDDLFTPGDEHQDCDCHDCNDRKVV